MSKSPEEKAVEVEALDARRAGAREKKKAAMSWCFLGPVGCFGLGIACYAAGLPPWASGSSGLAAGVAFCAAVLAAIVFAFNETRAANALKRAFRNGDLEDLAPLPLFVGERIGTHTVQLVDAERLEVRLNSSRGLLATQLLAVFGGLFLLVLFGVGVWQNAISGWSQVGGKALLLFLAAPVLAIGAVIWAFRPITVRWRVGPDAGGFLLETQSLLGGRRLLVVPQEGIDRLRLKLPALDLMTREQGAFRLIDFDTIDRSHGVADVAAEQANATLSRWRAQRVALAIESALGIGQESETEHLE